MKLDLPGDVLENLPDPDEQGLVRVSVAMRMSDDGSASVVEINDVPVDSADDDTEEEDSEDELPEEVDMPSPDDVAAGLM